MYWCVSAGGGAIGWLEKGERGLANSKWAFVKFFWRFALSGLLKGETHRRLQEKRASESTAGQRNRTAKRKRCPEWWEALVLFVLFFLGVSAPCSRKGGGGGHHRTLSKKYQEWTHG